MSVTIYHNPKCSKSRQTLELLQAKGIQPVIVEYLKEPPDKAALKKILRLLKLKPRDLMRKKEDVYKKAKLDREGLSDDALISAMIMHPVLIERPIVLANGKAAIGRPPENVLEIL
jgi:arsenate reductase